MIYIDCTRLVNWSGGYTGMERFAFQIIKHALLIKPDQVKLVYFMQAKGFQVVEDDAINLADDKLCIKWLSTPISIKKSLKQGKINTATKEVFKRATVFQKHLLPFMPTNKDSLVVLDGLWDNQTYINSLLHTPAAVSHVVHDIAAIIQPQLAPDYVGKALKEYFSQVTPVISNLISISKNTEKDFINIFGNLLKQNYRRIIIRHGDEITEAKPINPDLANIKPGKFILTVGTVEVRKNHLLLYQIYKLANERKIYLPPLVVVGKTGWMVNDTLHAIHCDPQVSNSFIFPGHITNEQLEWLYENCIFSIFPSFYEGWGLPVAESLRHNKVCLCSNTSSIPEVGGKLNKYFSPNNPSQALDQVLLMLDQGNRTSLEAVIKQTYNTVTWNMTTKKLINSLQ